MKTLQIPIKFQKGDTIYTIKQTKIELVCHICEGTGKIKYNEKTMKCPECSGVGRFKTNKQKYVICEDPFVLSTTKISITNNGNITIKYKGHCGFSPINRSEENLFTSKEEALKKCEELNKEKAYINIDDIIIKDEYKETHPSLDKISEKLEFYKSNNRFDKNIVLDRDNVLRDGYINYLIAKMLNLKIVKAVIE